MGPCADRLLGAILAVFSMPRPMNILTTNLRQKNPPPTPPKRGAWPVEERTSAPNSFPSWEGLGVGSGTQIARAHSSNRFLLSKLPVLLASLLLASPAGLPSARAQVNVDRKSTRLNSSH